MRTVFRFTWTYRGKSADNALTAKFSGDGWAADSREAIANVEAMMRKEHPTIRWMQGKHIEGEGVFENCTFGPSVRMTKTSRQVPDKVIPATT